MLKIILHLYVSRLCRPLTRQRMALYLISYKTNENEGKGCCQLHLPNRYLINSPLNKFNYQIIINAVHNLLNNLRRFIQKLPRFMWLVFLHFISEYPCFSTKSTNNMKDKQLAHQKKLLGKVIYVVGFSSFYQ